MIGNGAPHRRSKSSGLGQRIRTGDASPTLKPALRASPQLNPPQKPCPRPMRICQQSRRSFSNGRKSRFFLLWWKHFAIKHAWTVPLVLLLTLLLIYSINPTQSNILHHFIFPSCNLSPRDDADFSTPPQYDKDLWDIAFVSFYTVVLFFTREFIMQELLRPLVRFCGLNSRSKQLRFMEQIYTALYLSLMVEAGIFVMSRTPV
jgi:acyl-CoA-dependent ceramide synthase